MNHIIITPVFNEEEFLERFIMSIIKQINKPKLFILVDDNSNDNSAEIIKSFTLRYNWIKYYYYESKPLKNQGSKVVEAFNYGLSKIKANEVDIISKIDADLQFPCTYFSEINNIFENNPKVGICGGIIQEKRDNKWKDIICAQYHIRGALKSYRTSCFNEIGGIKPVLGWDGLDEMNALYLGWKTRIINTRVKHFRQASSDYNLVKLSYKYGLANYRNGGNLFLAIIRSLVRLFDKPYVIIGLSFMRGYLAGLLNGEKNLTNKKLCKFINNFHLKRLIKLSRY